MPLSPWYTGMTSPAWTLFCRKDNSAPVDLTGLVPSNLSLLIHPSSGGTDIIGSGTFTIVSAQQGIIQYQPATSDVAIAGSYQVFVVVNFANGPDISDPVPFTVMAR